MTDARVRCQWAGVDPLNVDYHDDEWGRPVADDHQLFEKLCLEGFQSGLSWLTILRKRPRFREVFHGFDPARVVLLTDADVERLMNDPGIVRNRAKILATINNARRYPEIVEEAGSLAGFLWCYEPDPDGARLSKDLRRRGWAFIGPTTAYAAMEAMGIVNNHDPGCFVRSIVEGERATFQRPAARRTTAR